MLGCALAVLAGCRVDMHVQPKLKPLRQSDFFDDQRSARPLVAGTVARGHLRQDAYFYSGMSGNQAGDVLPVPLTRELLERGRERFNIYCAPCHSEVGDGNGMVVQRGYRHPPSYHDERLVHAPIGHFFDVMTNGFGAMPDYASQVPPGDRWAIAAYIRVLQLSQHANLSDVPAGQRIAPAAPPSGVPGTIATPPPAQQRQLETRP